MNTNEELYKQLEEAKSFIERKLQGRKVKSAVTLGSGLGLFTDALEEKIEIPYGEIPHFHGTTVVGHAGKLVCGKMAETWIIAMQGRIHAYEGHSFSEVIFPTRVLKALGIENLILTNASGGMNPKYVAGDLVLITDHLNLTGNNPLYGPNPEKLGPRFPDMTNTWNKEIQMKIKAAAKTESYTLKEGTYVGVLGPSYETPAEIKMYQILGGDMVGMSTVAEAIAGHHCGLKIAGISCITNMAAGLHVGELDHADIKEQANKVKEVFVSLLCSTFKEL